MGHFGLSAYRILFFFIPKYVFRCGKPKNDNYFVEKLLTLKLAYIYQYFTEILRFLCALSPRKLT